MDKKTSTTRTNRRAPTKGGAAVTGAAGAPSQTKPATTFDPSGAPQQIVGDVDASHTAVDADPRAGTTEVQNRIDFNDPTKSGAEASADNLRAQSGK